MPYKKRVWVPERFYHVVCRGNRRDALFRDVDDFLAYHHILDQLYDRYPFEMSAYCLMTNHVHLQIRSQEVPLSKIMSLLNKRYANYFNSKYELTGHVYEKRFYDKLIYDEEDMLEVSRYIHLNPVVANMVKHPLSYPWSSFYLYKYQLAVPPRYINLNCILDYYQGTEEEKRERYCRSVVASQ
ncbi:transposase [Bacillus sp. B15-48]|uniref:REP-associated tyrosine transposase n=1 Tax=Bacillus sp. B15-48 TaxID=1548601 RepID=UPI00193FB0BB|nr:transposase [Bacillus sp. B15-48]MBM4761340.1 transposase [Bacillus sp. B15-48]